MPDDIAVVGSQQRSGPLDICQAAKVAVSLRNRDVMQHLLYVRCLRQEYHRYLLPLFHGHTLDGGPKCVIRLGRACDVAGDRVGHSGCQVARHAVEDVTEEPGWYYPVRCLTALHPANPVCQGGEAEPLEIG